MLTKRQEQLIVLVKEQIRPAVGCTEPASVAYAASVAARLLGEDPKSMNVSVSRNILKNAMGVGIPGTHMVGLPIAAALGALCGDASAVLAVLHSVTDEDAASAQAMIDEGKVTVDLADTEEKLYIDVSVNGESHTARAVIAGGHTRLVRKERDGQCLQSGDIHQEEGAGESSGGLSMREIDDFVRQIPDDALTFLRECVSMNLAIAEEGLRSEYGMSVGRSLYEQSETLTEEQYATALTCAAADARMGGCPMPVMSSCGSGNQGLTATLPIIAVAKHRGLPEKDMLRALTYSLLVTIHVKQHLGKLSALCACSVGASIGTACALTYLNGGILSHIGHCVDNVVADVSGVICDGAKAGCSLKIASGISSAFRAALLALKGHSATMQDGIVGRDVEASVDNLAKLCNTGMAQTDRVILDLLVCK